MSARAAITVRSATARDADALGSLFAELDGLHARLVPTYFRAAPRVAALELDDPTRAVLVAEAPGGALVGVAQIALYDAPESPQNVARRRAHVEDLVVEPAWRQHGVGRTLAQAVAQWARQRGAAEVVLTVWTGNEGADAFYRRLGYRQLSQVLSLEI